MSPSRLVFKPLWLLLLVAIGGGCDSAAPTLKQHRNAIHVAPPSDAAALDMPDADSGSGLRAEQRKACAFAATAPAEDTLDVGAPTGDAIPIDHFVVVMQENRSFDHYFQALPEFGQPDVHVAPPDFSNPKAKDSDERVTIHHNEKYCQNDLEHGWSSVHKQFADGSMQGFVEASSGDPEVMAYYNGDDLPYYYALANTFAIADHYFSDVLGPTFPNRSFLIMGSSHGLANNGPVPEEARHSSIFHRLAQANVDFKIYADQRVLEEKIIPNLRDDLGDHFASMNDYFDAAANGSLPAFAFVESSLRGSFDGVDEHPPSNVQIGQQFVASVLDALMQSPNWPKSAAFLTYDEHGGFYDHLAPPRACLPDDQEPQLTQLATPGRFDHFGMRVPLLVISPYAKAHYVSHHVFSHSSLLRLLEARFSLPAISARTANAEPPLDLFDFEHPAFTTPPNLPEAGLDPVKLQRCRKSFPYKPSPATQRD